MSEFESEFKGRVYLDRRIRETEWYTGCSANVVFLMFHLILSANYESTIWRGIKVKRGELVCSIGNTEHPGRLMNETRLSFSSLKRSLEKLEELGEIKVTSKKGFNGYTLISVLNYDLYVGMDKKTDSKSDNKAAKKTGNSKEVKEETIKPEEDEGYCEWGDD